jgi:hypothetical protein
VSDAKKKPPTEAEKRAAVLVEATEVETLDIVVPLAHPITANGVRTTELKLRRATGADMLWSSKVDPKTQGVEAQFELIGRLSEISPTDAQQLSNFDFSVVSEVITDFCFFE